MIRFILVFIRALIAEFSTPARPPTRSAVLGDGIGLPPRILPKHHGLFHRIAHAAQEAFHAVAHAAETVAHEAVAVAKEVEHVAVQVIKQDVLPAVEDAVATVVTFDNPVAGHALASAVRDYLSGDHSLRKIVEHQVHSLTHDLTDGAIAVVGAAAVGAVANALPSLPTLPTTLPNSVTNTAHEIGTLFDGIPVPDIGGQIGWNPSSPLQQGGLGGDSITPTTKETAQPVEAASSKPRTPPATPSESQNAPAPPASLQTPQDNGPAKSQSAPTQPPAAEVRAPSLPSEPPRAADIANAKSLADSFQANHGEYNGSIRDLVGGGNTSYSHSDPKLAGHEYLALNYIGKTDLSASQVSTLLDQNFGTVFPYGGAHNSLQADTDPLLRDNAIVAGRRFNLMIPKVLDFDPLRVSVGGPPVVVTEVGETHFALETQFWHPLQGTATHGIVKDASGEVWMYQYGHGDGGLLGSKWLSGLDGVRTRMNNLAAPGMWSDMAKNVGRLIPDLH